MKLGLVSTFKNENEPPIGLVVLATYLKKKIGFKNTKIIDITYDNVYEDVLKHDFDIIGISSMTAFFDRAIKIAEIIKEKKDIPVIIGGVHISTLPSCLPEVFDIGVVGEGEETFLELIKLYMKEGGFPKKKLRKIDGLVFRDKDGLVITEKRKLLEPLDELPILELNFLNRKYFKKKWVSWDERMGKIALLMTSRGCPYRCVFCSTSLFWQKVRLHSAEYVVKNVKYYHEKYSIDHFQIIDDLFSISKGRLKDILKFLEKEKLLGKVSFSCQPRANLMDEEMAQLLKKINVKSANFGFESGSERMLKWLKQDTVTVEDNKRACLLCKKYGIKTYGSFIFGSPGETIGDMRKTLKLMDFMIENGAYKLWHFVMTPFPGTVIWEIAKKRGKVSEHMDWRLLRHENYKEPLLLDESVPLKEFQKVYFEARDKLDKMWMGKPGWLEHTLLHDTKRLMRIAIENPGRAMNALKLIFEKRFLGK